MTNKAVDNEAWASLQKGLINYCAGALMTTIAPSAHTLLTL